MNTELQNEILTVSDVKISYQPKVKASQRPQLLSSYDIYRLLIDKDVFPSDTIQYKEYFKVILLNSANRVLGVTTISEGSTNQTAVDIKQIMQAAILSNSCYIIVCHNHPSSNCKPSHPDNMITKQIQDACKVMGITLLDHLIISPESYYSYADEEKI
jgi:DNA repair protein RadC